MEVENSVQQDQQQQSQVEELSALEPMFVYDNFARLNGVYVDPRLEAAFNEYHEKLLTRGVTDDKVIFKKLWDWEQKQRTAKRNPRPKLKSGNKEKKRRSQKNSIESEEVSEESVAVVVEEPVSKKKKSKKSKKTSNNEETSTVVPSVVETSGVVVSEKKSKKRKRKTPTADEDAVSEKEKKEKQPQSWLEACRRSGYLQKGQAFSQMPSKIVYLDEQGNEIPKKIKRVIQEEEKDENGKIIKKRKTEKIENPNYGSSGTGVRTENPKYYKIKELEANIMVEWCKEGRITPEKYKEWVQKRISENFYYDQSFDPSSISLSSSSSQETGQQQQKQSEPVDLAASS